MQTETAAQMDLISPAALIGLVAFACFWPALAGAYIGDDLRLVGQNHALRANDLIAVVTQPMFGREHGYWRPLLMLALWAGQLVGPFGIHALALGLHIANALAVRRLALRLVPRTAALWVAIVFAVHPVQAESVAWCSAINDPLWVACALQALLAALRWRDAGRGGPPLAAAGWVFLALTAKETGIAAIVLVAAALAWVPERRGRPADTVAWRPAAATLGLPLLAWLVLRAAVHAEPLGAVVLGSGVPLAGGEGPLRTLQVLLAQLCLLVAPLPQVPVRAVPELSPSGITMLAVAMVGVAAVAWRQRRRFGHGLRFAVALLLVPLLPPLLHARAIGLYPIADRYLYLTVAGGAVVLAHAAPLWRVRWLPWVLVAVSAPAAFLSSWNWHDLGHFAANAVRHAPDDPMVLTMAGDHQLDLAIDGDVMARGRAEAFYERALTGGPVVGAPDSATASSTSQLRRSLAAARLGLAWCGLLRLAAAREAAATAGDGASKAREEAVIAGFHSAVESAPEYGPSWVGLGIACGELRRPEAAAAAFREALRIDPQDLTARRGLAKVRGEAGRASGDKAAFRR